MKELCEYHTKVEEDAIDSAREVLNIIKAKRDGKFKISERQLLTHLEDTWVRGEFSAAERLLRSIEINEIKELPDAIAEIHLFILGLLEALKKRFKNMPECTLDDLINGKYSTDYMRSINPKVFGNFITKEEVTIEISKVMFEEHKSIMTEEEAKSVAKTAMKTLEDLGMILRMEG